MRTRPDPARARTTSFRSLRGRNFRLFAIGNLVSTTGLWVQLIAQNWLVLRLTGSTAALGLSVALQAVPMAALGLFGGVIADRLPRRRTLALAQAASMAVSLVLGVLVVSGVVTCWMLLVAAVVSGAIAAVEGPVSAAFGCELVQHVELTNAIALGSAVHSGGRILGIALGGALVATTGPGPAFFVNAVSFGAVLISLGLLRPEQFHVDAGRVDTPGSLRAAFRYVAADAHLCRIIGLACWLAAFGRNYQVTMAAMADGPLHAGSGGYSAASTAFAVGGLVGAFLIARVARPALGHLIVLAVVTGALQVVAGIAPGMWQFAAVILPIAAGAVALDTLVASLTQLRTTSAFRGRVAAIAGLASGAGAATGGPLFGYVCDTWGPRAALVAGGVVVISGAMCVTLVARERRFTRSTELLNV